MSESIKRFSVALSFPGEHRRFVSNVAAVLAQTFSEERVLYDKFHDAEFARADLNVYLPTLYRKDSELIVIFLCPEYPKKKWCRLEWRHINNLIALVDAKRIMFLAFGNPGDLSDLGILDGDGYIEISKLTPQVVAEKILKRLEINKGGIPPALTPKATSINPLHQLLPPPAAFTGREEEVSELETLLATSAGAAISGTAHAGLQGSGGVGKTALALVVAHRLKECFPGAQLYLNLHGAGADHAGHYHPGATKPVAPAEAMQKIIHSFQPKAQLPETLEELAPIYQDILSQAGHVLLLLDNAADAEQVRPLLPPKNCRLLVTSRAKIHLAGLASRDIDCLPAAKSQELLLRLAARIKGHEADATKLCGHLPLALEVFAGAVNYGSLTPVPELIHLLRQHKMKLSAVDAAFQVSFELLSEPLRRCWTLLGVFPAGFDRLAATAVWEMNKESALDAMQALVNASLVETNETKDRFRLHDLVRQFCEGKLSKPEGEAARLRHARHYRDVGDAADGLYLQGGAKVVHGLQLFDRERANIEAAFDWLQARSDEDSASLLISLVNAVAYVSNLRFHPRQRIGWLESQCKAARIVHAREAEGTALGNLGLAYAALGETRKAIEFYEKALAIDREIGNRRGEGAALGNLGLAYNNLGETRKAIEFYEKRLVIAREIGDRRGESAVLGSLGLAYAALGETRKAVEFHEQALSIAREIGDRRGESAALGNLGNAYGDLGETRKAIEFYEKALAIDREIGDRRGEGNALGNLGLAYADLGETCKAIEFYEKQLVITREIGDRRGEGNALWNSAGEFFKQGQRAEAVKRAESALAIYEAIEDPHRDMVRARLAAWRGGGK